MNPGSMTTEVIILAGGLGTRLQGVLGDIPKCMATVAGKPFLEYQLSYLQQKGYSRIILSVGHLRTPIMEHFGAHWNGCSIRYSVEETPLGTGGAILQASRMSTSGQLLVLNGDTYFRVETEKLHDAMHFQHADAVIALRNVPDSGRYGTVVTGENCRIMKFSEKDPAAGEGLINGGIYLMQREFILGSGFHGTFSLEKELFPRACSEKILIGVEYDDYFLDIGIPEDLERAQKELVSIG